MAFVFLAIVDERFNLAEFPDTVYWDIVIVPGLRLLQIPSICREKFASKNYCGVFIGAVTWDMVMEISNDNCLQSLCPVPVTTVQRNILSAKDIQDRIEFVDDELRNITDSAYRIWCSPLPIDLTVYNNRIKSEESCKTTEHLFQQSQEPAVVSEELNRHQAINEQLADYMLQKYEADVHFVRVALNKTDFRQLMKLMKDGFFISGKLVPTLKLAIAFEIGRHLFLRAINDIFTTKLFDYFLECNQPHPHRGIVCLSMGQIPMEIIQLFSESNSQMEMACFTIDEIPGKGWINVMAQPRKMFSEPMKHFAKFTDVAFEYILFYAFAEARWFTLPHFGSTNGINSQEYIDVENNRCLFMSLSSFLLNCKPSVDNDQKLLSQEKFATLNSALHVDGMKDHFPNQPTMQEYRQVLQDYYPEPLVLLQRLKKFRNIFKT